jgi:hypothetical protein
MVRSAATAVALSSVQAEEGEDFREMAVKDARIVAVAAADPVAMVAKAEPSHNALQVGVEVAVAERSFLAETVQVQARAVAGLVALVDFAAAGMVGMPDTTATRQAVWAAAVVAVVVRMTHSVGLLLPARGMAPAVATVAAVVAALPMVDTAVSAVVVAPHSSRQ